VSTLKDLEEKRIEKKERLRKSIRHRRSNFRVSKHLFVICHLQNMGRGEKMIVVTIREELGGKFEESGDVNVRK